MAQHRIIESPHSYVREYPCAQCGRMAIPTWISPERSWNPNCRRRDVLHLCSKICAETLLLVAAMADGG